MSDSYCQTCAYYQQHYSLDHRKLFRIHCGHCFYQRTKIRKPTAKACENYRPSESSDPFVTKEFLSKKLLEYMTSLELLPEIKDADTK